MSAAVRLSRARTVLLWGLAVVWFSEMALWEVRPLSELWTRFWVLPAPTDPQLATALYLTHAIEGAVKGAFFVLAVYALRSGVPFVRTALFVPMALVPPLNLLFQFRAQGFPIRPTLIGATLTVVLWQTFFVFKDGDPRPTRRVETPTPPHLSPSDVARSAWFGTNAVVLSVAAGLLLFAPDTGLRLTFVYLTGGIGTAGPMPPGLTYSAMAAGTHLAALAIATWIATAVAHRSPLVPRAVAAASTLHAALLCLLPLAQLARVAGHEGARSSLLAWSVLLLTGWVVYAAFSYRTAFARQPRHATPITR